MNLWIILAITWISISVVIADPKWFVHDSPLDGGDNEDLFSSEQLLPVQLKTHKNPKPAVPHITPKKQDQSHDKKVSKGADKPKPKPVVKQEANEIESENLILVHKKPTHATGRKPLQVVDDRKKVEVKTIKTDTKPVRSPQILDEEEPCDPEKDIDCLLETEDLILVSNKKVKPAEAKRLNQHAIKHDLVETMKTKEDIKPEVKKTEEADKSALHRRLLQRDGLDPEAVLRQKPALQPLLEEVVEEEEDVLANEIYSNDQQAEEIIRRFKRQIQTDEAIGSGDGGGASFMNTTDTTETPSFTMQLSITMEQKHDTGTLTPEEKSSYKDMFKTQLDGIFSKIEGTKAVVKNIRLDENNRVTMDWDLVITLTGARGTTDTTQSQNLLLNDLVTIGIPAVNNMIINGSVVYKGLEEVVVKPAAELLLKDTCQADNACPSEYICVRNEASLTYCHHKCYSSGLIDECQNGGACQINDNYEPYCQCGTGYSGTKCEQAPSSQSPSYTIGQIVGAGVGAAMMVIATASCCIYIAFFRKKKEEDMDYSYFGDDDSSGPGAFSDADTALGISNYYIDRPSVSLTPLDIYHQTGTHA